MLCEVSLHLKGAGLHACLQTGARPVFRGRSAIPRVSQKINSRLRVRLQAATMPEHAEAHSHTIPTNRNCTIEISNVSTTFCLVNPKVHMESGFTYNPPQPTLRSSLTEVCSFTKDDNTASGAVGVMTYELFDMRARHCNEVVAVMFSVPYDYTFYKNWLGVGIFEHTRACDGKLFDLMYNQKDFTNFVRHEADGSGVVYQGRFLDVRGCMSDEGKAIIKLELYDKMGR